LAVLYEDHANGMEECSRQDGIVLGLELQKDIAKIEMQAQFLESRIG